MKWDDGHRRQAWDDLYRVTKWVLYDYDDAHHVTTPDTMLLGDDPMRKAQLKAEKLFREIYEETGDPSKALDAAVADFRKSLNALLDAAEKARSGYKKALDSIDETTSDPQWGFKNRGE